MFIKLPSRDPHLRWAIEISLLAIIVSLIALLGWQLSTPTTAAQAQRMPTRTRTPIRAPTRTPTRTPTPATARFSLPGANKTNPGDVLNEIYAFGSGGGLDLCEQTAAYPVMIDLGSENPPKLFQEIKVQSCGWKNKERVNLLIQYPNGKQVNRQATAEKGREAYGVEFTFQSTFQDPPGVYKFTCTGQSGRASQTLKITRPLGPHAYWFKDTEGGRLFLYQLQPYEKVRLYAYAACGSDKVNCMGGAYADAKLVGWQDYQVDRYGSLWVSVANDKPGSTFAVLEVIGEKSGETGWNFRLPYRSINPFKHLTGSASIRTHQSCPGAPPQRIVLFFWGSVCTKRDRVVVREAPRRTARELFRLSQGTTFEVIGGPECSDNWSWWYILTQDGRSGWIAEGGDAVDQYFICPYYR